MSGGGKLGIRKLKFAIPKDDLALDSKEKSNEGI
jgi:hypothetical protein